MRHFDGNESIRLLSFLKDIGITFIAQNLTDGVAVGVFAKCL